MERITKRASDGIAYTLIPLNQSNIGEPCYTGFIADRLAEFEDRDFGRVNSMNEEKTLKPCPHCGGEGHLYRQMYTPTETQKTSIYGENTVALPKRSEGWAVECDDCGAMSETAVFAGEPNVEKNDISRKEAIAAWNKRAPDVVHCGECISARKNEYRLTDRSIKTTYSCIHSLARLKDDSYCSFGKRKDQAELVVAESKVKIAEQTVLQAELEKKAELEKQKGFTSEYFKNKELDVTLAAVKAINPTLKTIITSGNGEGYDAIIRLKDILKSLEEDK